MYCCFYGVMIWINVVSTTIVQIDLESLNLILFICAWICIVLVTLLRSCIQLSLHHEHFRLLSQKRSGCVVLFDIIPYLCYLCQSFAPSPPMSNCVNLLVPHPWNAFMRLYNCGPVKVFALYIKLYIAIYTNTFPDFPDRLDFYPLRVR